MKFRIRATIALTLALSGLLGAVSASAATSSLVKVVQGKSYGFNAVTRIGSNGAKRLGRQQRRQFRDRARRQYRRQIECVEEGAIRLRRPGASE